MADFGFIPCVPPQIYTLHLQGQVWIYPKGKYGVPLMVIRNPMMLEKMPHMEFGNLLTALLKERGLKKQDFAKLAGFVPGFLSGVIAGKRPPPLGQIEAWTEILLLRGDEKQRFLDLGYLTHCPEQIWTMVKALNEENKRLKERLGEVKL